MRSLILLGDPDTKRAKYFLKAADILGQPVTVIALPSFTHPEETQCETDMETALTDFDFSRLQNHVVKVDPPPPASYPIDHVNTVTSRYHAFLLELQRVPGIRLLNSSDAIWNTMDKITCKQTLQRAGLPTTPALTEADGSPVRLGSLAQLREIMTEKRIHQVFIKPRMGSGAAGVAAYRFNAGTGAAIMETSAVLFNNRLRNTKKLRKTGDSDEIAAIVNRLLAQDAIVESWVPKASHEGKTFDLRVVYQFGRPEFITARQSKGSITNLHLNDSALAVADLALSASQFSDLESLCHEAAALFPGLNVAGFDILLRQHTHDPMIIEINAQGDLIYQDIFAENRIYQAQIRAMKSL